MLEILVFLLGLVIGVIINLLADELPFRRGIARPTYYDGTPRPLSAWSGIWLFLTRQRLPSRTQADKSRQRLYFPELESERPDIWQEAQNVYYAKPMPLTWRYPLVELLTGISFVWTLWIMREVPQLSVLQFIFFLAYDALLVLILAIDVEHRLILRVVTYPAIALALLDALVLPQIAPNFQDALAGAGLGFGIFFVLYLGGYVFNYVMGQIRGHAIEEVAFGWGDVMLITFSGAVLGFAHTVLALFITVFLGAAGAFLFIVINLLRGKRYSAFTALPYGPYIIVATFIMLHYGDAVRIAMIGY